MIKALKIGLAVIVLCVVAQCLGLALDITQYPQTPLASRGFALLGIAGGSIVALLTWFRIRRPGRATR